jgi:hypothetical protein
VSKDSIEEKSGGGKPERKRRPYQKPAYRSERVFERMALSCGKVAITVFQCNTNRKTS